MLHRHCALLIIYRYGLILSQNSEFMQYQWAFLGGTVADWVYIDLTESALLAP